jgi:hypothetical protein
MFAVAATTCITSTYWLYLIMHWHRMWQKVDLGQTPRSWLPTHWSRYLLEKPEVAQGVRKFLTCYRVRRIITMFTWAHLVPSLRQMNPTHALQSYFFKIHFSITLPSVPRSSQWSWLAHVFGNESESYGPCVSCHSLTQSGINIGVLTIKMWRWIEGFIIHFLFIFCLLMTHSCSISEVRPAFSWRHIVMSWPSQYFDLCASGCVVVYRYIVHFFVI